MKVSLLILTACVVLTHGSYAYEPDIKQKRTEEDGVSNSVDHLIPTGAGIPEKPPLYYIAQFGRYPSFSDAFEWRVSLKDGKYILSSWRLERMKRYEEPRNVEVLETEVPKHVAAVIYTMWANGILDARYTRHPTGIDGTTYEFSTYLRGVGWPRAQTWSPDEESPPKWLMDAGEAVLKFARAKGSDSAALFIRLQAIGKRLAAYKRPNNSLQPIAPKSGAPAE